MKFIFGAIKRFDDSALRMARQLGSEGFHFNTPPIRYFFGVIPNRLLNSEMKCE